MGVPFWTDLLPANPDPLVAQTKLTENGPVTTITGSFYNTPDYWSVVYVGSPPQLLPGLLDNGDVTWRKPPHRVIDKTHKPSTDGTDPTLLGFGTAEFDLRLVVHTPTQLTSLQNIIPQIFRGVSTSANPGQAGQATNGLVSSQAFNSIGVAPGNGIPGATTTIGLNLTQTTPGGGGFSNSRRDRAVLVFHPALALANITAMIVEKWTPPVRWNGKNDVKMYVLHCLEHRNSTKARAQKLTQVSPPVTVSQKTLPVQNKGTSPAAGGSGPGMTLG